MESQGRPGSTEKKKWRNEVGGTAMRYGGERDGQRVGRREWWYQ